MPSPSTSPVRAPLGAFIPRPRFRVRARRAVRASGSGVDVVVVDAAARAGLIVFVARVGALALGKAKQANDVERGTREARERGIDCDDLFVSEDADDRWYLIGPWRAPRRGDPKFGAGRMSQEINGRVRYHDAKIAAKANGVKYEDIEELKALYPTTPKKFVELRRRLKEAGVEVK